MKARLIIGLILFILPLGYLIMDYGYEFFDVNTCLDLGGSYDYEKYLCDKEENHPYIPYWNRKKELILMSISVSILGILLFVRGRRKYENNK
jgi:hypothetical protein